MPPLNALLLDVLGVAAVDVVVVVVDGGARSNTASSDSSSGDAGSAAPNMITRARTHEEMRTRNVACQHAVELGHATRIDLHASRACVVVT
jgi:hypothetical protein